MKIWTLERVSQFRIVMVSGMALVCLCPLLVFANVEHDEGAGASPSACESVETCYRLLLDQIPVGQDRLSSRDAIPLTLERLLLLRKGEPDSEWSHRGGVLAGVLLREQDPSRALQLFEEEESHFPIIQDYIFFWRGETFFNLGEFQKSAQVYTSLSRKIPDSLIKDLAIFRSGEAWYKAGNCPQSMAQFKKVSLLTSTEDFAPVGLLQLADCQIRTIQTAEGLESLKRVWIRFPMSNEAHEAEVRLHARAEGAQWVPNSTSVFNRGKVLLSRAYYPEAIQAFRTFLKQEPNHTWREEARFNLALALSRLKRYDEAHGIFRDLVKRRGDTAGESAVWLAKIYLRTGRGESLRKLPHLFGKISLSPSQKSTILFYLGVWLEDQKHTDQAVAAYKRTGKLQPGSKTWLRSLWRIGWIYYQAGSYKKAAQTFNEIVRKNKPTNSVPQFLYWMGRSLEQDNKERALETFNKLCEQYSFTYYGQLDDRCSSVDGDAKPPTNESPQENADDALAVETHLHSNTHFRKAIALQKLGLKEDAARELSWLVRSRNYGRTLLFELAMTLRGVGAQHEALRIAKIYFQEILDGSQATNRRNFWHLAYPDGYLSVIKYFSQGLVDPYLVAAIIREESLYDAQALSSAGAIGLMQLMPATAQTLTNGSGNLNGMREQLFDSQTNIRLGSIYLGNLVKRFSGNVIHAVAAYNAGPHVVKRWIQRNGNVQPDEFVELIPYRETRGYVKRVLRSYRAYHRIHHGACKADSLDRVC